MDVMSVLWSGCYRFKNQFFSGSQSSNLWGEQGGAPPKSFPEKNLKLFQIKMFF